VTLKAAPALCGAAAGPALRSGAYGLRGNAEAISTCHRVN
jgi:hypothetical protein